jgi:hypothetical protein
VRKYPSANAADRVAGDGDALRVEAVGGPLAHDPPGRGVSLFEGDGIGRLRRAVVLDERDGGPGADGQFPDEPVMRGGVAEHPAAAVHVQDHRLCPGCVRRPDDAHPHVADLGRHGDPAVLDR